MNIHNMYIVFSEKSGYFCNKNNRFFVIGW